MNHDQFANELAHIRRRERLLWLAVLSISVVFGSALAFEWYTIQTLAHPQTLRLRRLDIIDQKGVSRVILAAPTPPPTHFGKVGRRDGVVSGILLADATGTERGGYVTTDGDEPNAMLTLDAQGKQTVLLLAEPRGHTLFRIWNGDMGSLVMGASDSGPFLNVRQKDKLFFSAPSQNPESHDPRFLFK